MHAHLCDGVDSIADLDCTLIRELLSAIQEERERRLGYQQCAREVCLLTTYTHQVMIWSKDDVKSNATIFATLIKSQIHQT